MAILHSANANPMTCQICGCAVMPYGGLMLFDSRKGYAGLYSGVLICQSEECHALAYAKAFEDTPNPVNVEPEVERDENGNPYF